MRDAPGLTPRRLGPTPRRLGFTAVVWAVWLFGLAALWLCSGMMAAQDVGIAVLFMTCGLGIPLLFVATVAAYATLLLPAVALAPLRRLRWLGLVQSVGLVLAFALLPHRCAESDLAARLAVFTADDVTGSPVSGVRTLEVLRPTSSWEFRDGPLPDEACDPTCRALLLGGELDWVQVTLRDFRGEATSQVRIATERGERCAVEGPVDASATCLVYVPMDATPADLTLEVTDAKGDQMGAPGWLVVPRAMRRFEAKHHGRVVLRTSATRVEVVFAPTILGTELTGMTSSGLTMQRSSRDVGPVSLEAALRALGFSLGQLDAIRALESHADWRKPPSDELTRQVVSILDLPTPELAEDQQRLIDQWSAAARAWSQQGAWDDGRIALLKRLLHDRRVDRLMWLDQIVRSDAKVATALLPELLDLTEAHGTPDDAAWSNVWYGYRTADEAVLAPHADRLAALLDGRDARDNRLLPLAGRLGRDPSRWLLPLASDDEELTRRRVVAACLAAPTWSAAVVPPLRALWATIDPARDTDLAEAIGRALQRHGDGAWIDAQVATLGHDQRFLARRISSAARFDGASSDLCR